MFHSLSDNLENTFRKLRGQGKISEKNIADAMREIRLALLEADVEFSVAKQLIANIKDKAMGAEVLKSVKPGEQIVMVATTSRHRDAAFESARFLMDFLKSKAPFWKLEQAGEEASWVDAREMDEDALMRWD